MNAEHCIGRMISLFDEYSEWFGLTNADCPDDAPEDKQLEFEDKFNLLICDYRGHEMGPDHCYRCGRLRIDIESEM